uniref:Uncharacterized protein n=1 Tax=Romanomermis culicivorax TaxID=13658 RepID=A0A915JC90_ROMCU
MSHSSLTTEQLRMRHLQLQLVPLEIYQQLLVLLQKQQQHCFHRLLSTAPAV